MTRREPVLLAVLLAWALNRLLDALGVDSGALGITPEALEGTVELVLLVGGALWARSRVFSEQTIRDAGISPSSVEIRAKSPLHHTYEGE